MDYRENYKHWLEDDYFDEATKAVSYTHLDVYKRQCLFPGRSLNFSREPICRELFIWR